MGYQGEIVFTDASAEIDFTRMRQDAETGYRVPLQIRVTGRQGSDRATWRARGENLDRRDLLKDYGPLVRFLARTITHPYQYRLDADYSLDMAIQGVEATVRGRGEYSMDYFQ